jgi:beta-ureidopropionase
LKATIGLIQMNFSDSREDNLARGADLVREAAGRGAEIVCLSELATSQYFCFEMNRDFMRLAEPVGGPSTQAIAAAAKEAGIWAVLPFYELGEDGQLYNSAVVIDRAGEVAGVYRKNIIPLMQFDGVTGVEKFYFRPGNLGYPVFKTDLGITIGITICYERHFPEGPRALALAGADLIFVPTATPAGQHMWETELRAMAIANLLWVGGINRIGRDRGEAVSQMEFYGGSLVAGPDGVIREQAEGTGEDEVVISEIDTDLSEQLREDWGFFRDRRPDIYGALTAP